MQNTTKIDLLFELIQAKNRVHETDLLDAKDRHAVTENQLRYKDQRVFDLESWIGAIYMLLFNVQSSTYIEMDKELFQRIRVRLMELLANENKPEEGKE